MLCHAMLQGLYLDGTPVMPYVALPGGLAITTAVTLLYIRSKLDLMWDVQLKIRPPQYFDPSRDLSFFEHVIEYVKEQMGY